VRPLEAVVGPGELLFIPRGWWHTALNLEPDTLAVTHNWVSPASLPAVLDWLASRRPDLVSGCGSSEQR
jgi:ribosomal protein L16 Arg81 hydroxylase